ncbi:hypothetical protein CSC94_15045 [Zhengella mangrovi]|uniref:DUF937 domain-containing protein n=1 Tax=Zhengella mangrovi TaxID=1982044 RepID=A0A2G1QL40_9HYPH|nr:DUF937 domain-containing protein [Zhengella mangrovi]PHP66247.1 hypothetical protein CSC94_15045 [Zhengella mangrovi]
MAPLLDMMMNMQNGEAVRQMARQFQLSQEQTTRAMEALMPAFSEGLKRNAQDPFGVANFLNALATGQHARYWENMQAAFQPQGIQNGNGILGHLFGSPDVSRAIARQAEAATGIAQEIYKQMMPVLANLVMGGLYKQSTGQASQAGSFGAAGNPIGDIIEQMMRQGTEMWTGGQQQQRTPRAEPQNPFDNPFGKMLEGMFGGGAQPQQQPQNPMANNPLGRIFEDFLRSAQGGSPAAPEQPGDTAGKERATGGTANPYDNIFGEMFESGRRARDDYQRNVENIFDQFLKGMDRSR